MNRFPKLLGTMAFVTLLAGCATYDDGFGDGGYYAPAPRYAANDYSCDYYTPPWGYPSDYCRYQTWNDPVYFQGVWYSGPVYYRNYAGANWFWLNGDWRRDEWRGPRPVIDWNRNRYWRGEIVRARDNSDRRRDVGDRRDLDNRRDVGNRNAGNGLQAPERDLGNRNDPAPRTNGGDGRFGGRGRANVDRANNGPPPGGANNGPPPGGAPGPRDGVVQGGRFEARGPANAERANNAPQTDGGRGVRNNAVNSPPPGNGRNGPPPAARTDRNGDAAAIPSQPARGGLLGGLARARGNAARTEASAPSDDNNSSR